MKTDTRHPPAPASRRGRLAARCARWLWSVPVILLSACGGQPPKPVEEPAAKPQASVTPPPAVPEKKSAPAGRHGGGFYLDDGPLDDIPVDLAGVPDAVPRPEPLHRFANRPYSVLGRDYTPRQTLAPFRQQGIASWYGRRYHGQKTSSGEPYDMFAMTAAHPTLPIPSYVRVSRSDTGKSVVVRVNDRGPFLHGRVIDLSYVAAWKLGIVENGSGQVLVENLQAGNAGTATKTESVQAAQTAENPPRVLADIVEKGDGAGHYLQLGAFSSRDNAESLKLKLGRELGELGDKLTIRSAGNLHRLQLGPWQDAGEAKRIAEQLKLAFELPSVLVK